MVSALLILRALAQGRYKAAVRGTHGLLSFLPVLTQPFQGKCTGAARLSGTKNQVCHPRIKAEA